MEKISKYVIIVVAIFSSCNASTIIPSKDMVSILVKIQLIDAAVININNRQAYLNKDTIDYYGKTIESFGYTKAQFDSSLKYYSADTKELDKIYDKVIIELSKLETKNNAEVKVKEDSISSEALKNLWPLKPHWEDPADGEVNFVPFEIPVVGEGIYTISADIIVYPDDESVRPTLTAYFFFDDKSEAGNRSVVTSTELSKDGIVKNYQIKLELNNSLVTHLKGLLFESYNTDMKFKKHNSASNILITYKPFPKNVKKLRKEKRTPVQID